MGVVYVSYVGHLVVHDYLLLRVEMSSGMYVYLNTIHIYIQYIYVYLYIFIHLSYAYLFFYPNNFLSTLEYWQCN